MGSSWSNGLNESVVVVGAGGHAKVVVELLRESGYEVFCCIGTTAANHTCLGAPVLIGDHHLSQLRAEGHVRSIVAIGDNLLRLRLMRIVRDIGYELVNAIGTNAKISPSAEIGRGVAIMNGAVINANAIIRDCAIVNTGATIDHDCQLGLGVHIAPQCGVAGSVSIGDGAFLGIGSVVIPGIKIGRNVILGAGSVVTSDLPPNVVAVGAPARIVRHRVEL